MKINKRLVAQLAVIFALNLTIVLCLAHLGRSEAATYSQGSQGETVKLIQTKLKRWGYYAGALDGQYGAKTADAVRAFQKTNGLKADGVCGAKTLAALGISAGSSTTSTGSGTKDSDMNMLARIISAEARGEPYEGQVAVGAVILNRIAHPGFPSTMAGVIYQPGAFSPIADGQYNAVTIVDSARRAAQDAMNGSDPTGGAIYFYNPGKSTSKWIFTREVVLIIGQHHFAK